MHSYSVQLFARALMVWPISRFSVADAGFALYTHTHTQVIRNPVRTRADDPRLVRDRCVCV